MAASSLLYETRLIALPFSLACTLDQAEEHVASCTKTSNAGIQGASNVAVNKGLPDLRRKTFLLPFSCSLAKKRQWSRFHRKGRMSHIKR